MRLFLKTSITVLLFIGLIMIIHSCKKEEVPTLTTAAITNITGTTATSGGTITDEGSGTVITRGICWSTNITPTIADNKTQDGAGAGTFTSNLSGLSGATTYYVRAYATNSAGTGYGMAMSFTTLGQLPTAITQPATNVTTTSATLDGTVNANYLSTDITFEYGTTLTYSNSIAAKPSPVTGSTSTNVSSNISGLTAGTTYHFRIKAINSLGTIYSNDLAFTTLVADIDGNIYNIVTIGTQIWMTGNLKTINYNDGTAIPFVMDGTAWAALTTPGYCWYNNNAATYKATYGAIYNWYTINTGKLCPTGWHVPTDAEWSTLTTYLGGESVAGGKLKESGTDHWASTGATNEMGFTALPGGFRAYNGVFYQIGYEGYWWSSTEYDTGGAWGRYMSYSYGDVYRIYVNKQFGFSVRCLKD